MMMWVFVAWLTDENDECMTVSLCNDDVVVCGMLDV